jgi:hypothetical protein
LSLPGCWCCRAAQDTASNIVKDAYSSLKALLQRRFQGKPSAEMALAEAETDPETWKKPLAKAVAEHGSDEEVLTLAQQLLQVLQAQQSVASPKYNIKIDNAQGTIFEPQAPVTQHFGRQPPRARE